MKRPRPISGTQPGEFGRVLVAIFAVYLSSAVIDQSRWSGFVLVALSSGVLVMALRAAGVSRVERHAGNAIIVVLVVGSLIGTLAGPNPSQVAAWSWAAMAFLTIGVILRRLLSQPEVTVHTLGGVVCAYLLFGLAFSALYRGLDLALEEGFFVQQVTDAIDFTYFSFVTLTTLGYGDLTPGSPVGKALVTIEALVGQVFLVTVVAVVVGNLGRRREVAPPAEGSDATGDLTDP